MDSGHEEDRPSVASQFFKPANFAPFLVGTAVGGFVLDKALSLGIEGYGLAWAASQYLILRRIVNIPKSPH